MPQELTNYPMTAIQAQPTNNPTTRICDRCGQERPYADQWVEIICYKGSRIQYTAQYDWDCWLEVTV